MIRKVINELKKYVVGRKNTEKVEVSVLNLNRLIFALEEQESMLDKMRAEIEHMDFDFGDFYDHTDSIVEKVLQVIDKYKTEREVKLKND